MTLQRTLENSKELLSLAGFFGLFDYTKEGPGVKKGGPKKKRFFQFFDILFRKFSKLILLNLLYCVVWIPFLVFGLFMLPSSTIIGGILLAVSAILYGPATAGLTYILRNMILERPVFMTSDFMDRLKSNFRQGAICGVLQLGLTGVLIYAIFSYFILFDTALWVYAAFGFCLLAAILFCCIYFYIYLIIITVDVPLFAAFKNAFIFTVLGFKSNIVTFLVNGVLIAATAWFFPISAIFLILIGFSLIHLIACFNSYPYVQKYIITPYREAHPEANTDIFYHWEDEILQQEEEQEQEEPVFSDQQLLPQNDDEKTED